MKTRFLTSVIALVVSFTSAPLCIASEAAESLQGRQESFPQWGSGSITFAQPKDFRAGDTLQIKIGGTASKVIVRLLPKGESPATSVGVVGGPIDIPPGRTVEITLPEDRLGIIQVSVHGGPNPWDEYPLSPNNGPASITSASVIRKH